VILLLILKIIPEILEMVINLIDAFKVLIESVLNLFYSIQDIKILDIEIFLNKSRYVIKSFFMSLVIIYKVAIYVSACTVSILLDSIIDVFVYNWNNKISMLFRSIIVWYEIDFTNFFANYDNEFINNLKEGYELTQCNNIERKKETEIFDIELFSTNQSEESVNKTKHKDFQLISCIITITIFFVIASIMDN
jgi:hypothetical protein